MQELAPVGTNMTCPGLMRALALVGKDTWRLAFLREWGQEGKTTPVLALGLVLVLAGLETLRLRITPAFFLEARKP
jgi:hypothetical protein